MKLSNIYDLAEACRKKAFSFRIKDVQRDVIAKFGTDLYQQGLKDGKTKPGQGRQPYIK